MASTGTSYRNQLEVEEISGVRICIFLVGSRFVFSGMNEKCVDPARGETWATFFLLLLNLHMNT